jgi:hypothetical protein
LLSAIAFEHADCPAIHGIEHRPNLGRLLAANAASPDWIGVEAGKDFVLESAVHWHPSVEELLSAKQHR